MKGKKYDHTYSSNYSFLSLQLICRMHKVNSGRGSEVSVSGIKNVKQKTKGYWSKNGREVPGGMGKTYTQENYVKMVHIPNS